MISLKFYWAFVRPSCNPRQYFFDWDLPFLRGDREFLNRIIWALSNIYWNKNDSAKKIIIHPEHILRQKVCVMAEQVCGVSFPKWNSSFSEVALGEFFIGDLDFSSDEIHQRHFHPQNCYSSIFHCCVLQVRQRFYPPEALLDLAFATA